MLNDEGNVLAFAAFHDSPQGMKGLYDDLHFNCWEKWFEKACEVSEFNAQNSLWMVYFVVAPGLLANEVNTLLSRIFQTVYTSVPEVNGVLLLQSKHPFHLRGWSRSRWPLNFLLSGRVSIRRNPPPTSQLTALSQRHSSFQSHLLLIKTAHPTLRQNQKSSSRRSRWSRCCLQLSIGSYHWSLWRILPSWAHSCLELIQQGASCSGRGESSGAYGSHERGGSQAASSVLWARVFR